MKLFKRNARGVELTDEGKELKYYVDSAYNALCRGEKMISGVFDELTSGEISIGTPSHIRSFLPIEIHFKLPSTFSEN